ncbi:DUF4389 domain-containing protein [Amnibacterium kyonggiense]|uniref:Uncharacterized protein DUF4389 n=1 Tax=Amnibacterium kyonggiense TaxID=595671 RepID=A0A4R7FKG4_9MICO|nr:DUF4389 domain-containing protein [Amnibacterium kyonggiense]TDS76861.1 uncharacterized protein DUF4389 [Amnibacterium kyonggiense]
MTTSAPATTAPTGRPHRTSAGGVVLVVVGVLLVAIATSVLAAALAVGARDPRGWFTSPTASISTGTVAVTTADVAGIGTPVPALPVDLGRIRIRVQGDRPLFVGIAPREDVDRYLSGVARTEVVGVESRPFRVDYRDVLGSRTPDPPTAQDFWVARATGTGSQEVVWPVRAGRWAVVVMNADATAGVTARVQAAYATDLLAPLVAGAAATAGVLLLVGVPLLLTGTAAVGRALDRDAAPEPGQGPPVVLTARTDAAPSRWLWLVKWLLAVPHLVLLAGLWIALTVTTAAAGVVVLFTGRYPRSWFAFDVGVLRWSWRVAFYGYAALGTDRYPPFALAPRDDYPADLRVARPERLTNGLVLVKWWLLAVPHYLVLAALTGGWLLVPTPWPWSGASLSSGISVLGVLVLVTGVLLLITGRYHAGLRDLVVGIDRWAFRVAAYALLLRDEYPPFRLDQGEDERTTASAAPAGGPR